jgi:DNA repair protein RecN (Recombination protein N)
LIGKYLVDLHGPHEHQSLLSQDRQLDLLDAYVQSEKPLADYRKAYSVWHRAQREIEEFRGLRMATGQEIDLLRYQLEEIDNADLDLEDVADLETRYALCKNGARLVDSANRALVELSGSVVNGLADVQRSLRELEKYDPSVSNWSSGFDGARVEIEEVESALREYVGDLEFDPAEIVQMEARIDQLESLKRKYGQTIEEVIAYGETARERLSKIDGHEGELARLEKDVLDALGRVETMGDRLTKLRRKAAPKLAQEIAGHLEDLGFKQSIFDVSLQTGAIPNPRGFEEADFLFAPNPGEPPKPLRIIASSGEMSRVMLAIKSALAHEDQIPLMVFDEIDANVGGEIAHAVGRKMATLGEQHQVVAITHMPQVAALAHCHYVVSKEFGKDETHSTLRQVKNKDRVQELARMLGGVGDQSLALAESLLVA